jgi:hypothetical protein
VVISHYRRGERHYDTNCRYREEDFDFHFPAYGSLYHKKDLDGETQILVVEDFYIGPVSARQFWYGERSKIEIDRGPYRFLPSPFLLYSLFKKQTYNWD